MNSYSITSGIFTKTKAKLDVKEQEIAANSLLINSWFIFYGATTIILKPNKSLKSFAENGDSGIKAMFSSYSNFYKKLTS